MPSVIKGTTTITYSVAEVLSLLAESASATQRRVIRPNDIELLYEGGYKSCDCDSWGGPAMCSCKESTKTLVGFRIVLKDV